MRAKQPASPPTFRFLLLPLRGTQWLKTRKGDAFHQVTPGISLQLASFFPSVEDLWVSADLVISKGVGGSLSALWNPTLPPDSLFHHFSYFTKWILYNGFTLYGERNMPSFENKNTAFDLILGVNLKY